MVDNESALPEMPGPNQSLPEHSAWITVTEHQLHGPVRDIPSSCRLGNRPVSLLDHCWPHDHWLRTNQQYSTKHTFYQLLNHEPDEPPVEPNLEHLNHFWEYLRQGLMCNADVTLKWHKYGEAAGTGWGYQHQRKDWAVIIAWVEDHRMTNDYGIIRGGGV